MIQDTSSKCRPNYLVTVFFATLLFSDFLLFICNNDTMFDAEIFYILEKIFIS